jgi:hypothetical protein
VLQHVIFANLIRVVDCHRHDRLFVNRAGEPVTELVSDPFENPIFILSYSQEEILDEYDRTRKAKSCVALALPSTAKREPKKT